ncbi:hypothetical protein [Cystobacter fuscus]|uniref:hypothetical protein n=1 Tax=Cystobacter fuscus TaxID=43 RepID=UPI0037C0DFFD
MGASNSISQVITARTRRGTERPCVSQHLRGKHFPSTETTLYYGLHSAFALGQFVFGLLGLWLAWHALDMLKELPVVMVSVVAAVGWLAISVLFMEYWQPRFNAAIFGVLVVTAALTGRR